jgi:hypothetical protein
VRVDQDLGWQKDVADAVWNSHGGSTGAIVVLQQQTAVVAVEHPHSILGVFKAAGRAGRQSISWLLDWQFVEKNQGRVQQLSIKGSNRFSHHLRFQTKILLISSSQAARITDVHHCAGLPVLFTLNQMPLGKSYFICLTSALWENLEATVVQ